MQNSKGTGALRERKSNHQGREGTRRKPDGFYPSCTLVPLVVDKSETLTATMAAINGRSLHFHENSG